MDAHTLDLLQFERIRETLAGYATSAVGKRRAKALAPIADAEALQRAHDQTRELGDALAARMSPPLGGLRDVETPVRRAALGVLLELEPLLDIREVLELTGRVHDYALRLGPDYPSLEKMLAGVRDYRNLARAIDAVVDAQGRVRDSASVELAAVRKDIARHEERIQAEIRRLLRDPEIRKALRYSAATVSNDHRVLPVSVNHRHKVVGVVHRTSSSGETVFIEPAKVAEIGAQISLLQSTEQREIRKVLRRLTDLIQREAEPLLQTIQTLAELDYTTAKARFAEDFQMSTPTIAEGPIAFVDARHPLLEALFRDEAAARPDEPPRVVVPVTVRLGDNFDVLIITGPNTGGKTVALKTVGLLCAMALSGMPIPAKPGSRLPMLENVLADVGDEQSIEQSLSTFSGHMSRIAEILSQAGPKTLVLLDELGAGTEPSEGAALGRAILDELRFLKCRAMVTTHLNDLKTYAYSAERVENAAAEFNAETLQPTYRLVIGQIGESCALKIARRWKLPRRLVARAHKYLRRRVGKRAVELEQLQKIRQEAEVARQQALEAEAEARRAAEEFQRKSDQLRQEEDVSAQLEVARAALRPGDAVRVARFAKSGKVVRVDARRKQAVVAVGAIEWELPLDELVPIAAVPPAPSSKR